MNRGGLPPMWQAGVGVTLPLYRSRIASGVAEAEASRRAGEHAWPAARAAAAGADRGAARAAAGVGAPVRAVRERGDPAGPAGRRGRPRQLPRRGGALRRGARGAHGPLRRPRGARERAGRPGAAPRPARVGEPRGGRRRGHARPFGRRGRDGPRRAPGGCREEGRDVLEDPPCLVRRPSSSSAGLALLAGGACRREQACRPGRHRRRASGSTTVPMHPTYVADRPGQCPICGMDLVPTQASPPPTGERKVLYYRSPMDPKVRSDRPPKDSMGMDFVPVYEDELKGEGAGVAGRAMVTLTPERRQFLGVQTAEVREAPLGRTVRTVGRLAVDERRVHHVHVKYDGVRRAARRRLHRQAGPEGRSPAGHLQPRARRHPAGVPARLARAEAARRKRHPLGGPGRHRPAPGGAPRLLLWDIRRRGHRGARATGEVRRTLDLHADLGGYVLMKGVVMGQRVTPQPTRSSTSPTSRTSGSWPTSTSPTCPRSARAWWARSAVPTCPGGPGRGGSPGSRRCRAEKTRTVKVRLEVDNTGDDLKPDMFADVYLKRRARAPASWCPRAP